MSVASYARVEIVPDPDSRW